MTESRFAKHLDSTLRALAARKRARDTAAMVPWLIARPTQQVVIDTDSAYASYQRSGRYPLPRPRLTARDWLTAAAVGIACGAGAMAIGTLFLALGM